MSFMAPPQPNVAQDNFLRRLAAFTGQSERPLYQGELDYFRGDPNTAGMAAADDRVITNPYSSLLPKEMDALRQNEQARIFMRGNPQFAPGFDLTNEQSSSLGGTAYAQAPDKDRRATIAARILTGDPSAGNVTPEQAAYVRQLLEAMQANKGKK